MILIKRDDIDISGDCMIYDPTVDATLPRFKVVASKTAGYTDISSIENFYKFGSLAGEDYKKVRSEIKNLYISLGWNSLRDKEKDICSRLFISTKSERDQIFSLSVQKELGLIWHKNSVDCRMDRYNYVVVEIFTELSSLESVEVMNDIVTNFLAEKYVYYGLEGTLENNKEGLFDYLEARVGTSYENTGLASKGFIPRSMTLNRLVLIIMYILKNGNYNE